MTESSSLLSKMSSTNLRTCTSNTKKPLWKMLTSTPSETTTSVNQRRVTSTTFHKLTPTPSESTELLTTLETTKPSFNKLSNNSDPSKRVPNKEETTLRR